MSSKSALATGAEDHPPTESSRTTRSGAKLGLQQAGTTPQAATLEKKKQKAKEAREAEAEARKTLIAEKVLPEGTDVTLQTLTRSLSLTISKHASSIPQSTAKILQAIATLMQEASSTASQLTLVVETLTQKVTERVEKSMQEEMEKLSASIKNSMVEQCKAMCHVDTIAETVASLKQVATDMNKTIGEATTATTHITDTAQSYKQALLQAAPQTTLVHSGRQPQSDPRLLRDIDRKERQILIDTADPKISNGSQAEIKEKVRSAIAAITNPLPPSDTTIIELNKLKKGGFTILFKEKEVITWLSDPEVKSKLMAGIATDAAIASRSYSVMIPRIPITFDPANDTHLREIEEVNEYPVGAIEKARWIKPEYRRTAGQKAAHAIFIFKDVTIANQCIRDGLYVCGLRIRPSRLKHEPLQCMKCRKWGHFANACLASVDTCGTCGEEHRTSECTNKGKTYCVSCKSDEHASWDRDCPEFQRRCAQYDENYPENNLTYFPTHEDWTLTPQPNRYQFQEKFPSRFGVTYLPPPRQSNRMPATGPSGRQRRQRAIKLPPNQSTMDNYFASGSNQQQPNGSTDRAGPLQGAEDLDTTAPYYDCDLGEEPRPNAWD